MVSDKYQTTTFKAGFQKGKEWAVDRCRIEMVDAVPGTDDEAYNRAILHCIEAIIAMDVRHAAQEAVEESADAGRGERDRLLELLRDAARGQLIRVDAQRLLVEIEGQTDAE